jgi:hypothetical protein
VTHLYGQLDARVDGEAFKFVGPDREDVVEWAADAWSALSTSTIVHGFKKAQVLVSLPSPRHDVIEQRAQFDVSLDAVVKAMLDLKLVDMSDVVRGQDDVLDALDAGVVAAPLFPRPLEN